MRIAIINWTRRRVGGVETYLSTVIPELYRTGHDVALWHELDVPSERDQISLPPQAPAWCAAELGVEASLKGLRDWQPDVVYSHKVEDPDLEEQTLQIAPAVYFAHDYQGMCISGHKTFKFPIVKPCERQFDQKCLAHYFPHRCGGLSPLTMVKLYRLQSRRHELLHQYRAIVTHSDHMLRELISHGLPAKQAYSFPYYVERAGLRSVESNAKEPGQSAGNGNHNSPFATPRPYWRLLFSGRMEFLKGGRMFLDALPKVIEALRQPLRITFAGDGRARRSWELYANRLQARHSELEFNFIGWTPRSEMNALLADCDLLVVPSIWPEPFGLVGPEAGLKNVPVAAFDVGGISDWLEDGVNGYLAPGNPPTAEGLAQAIIKCLQNPEVHASLARNAEPLARRFNIKNHLDSLMSVFESVAKPSVAKPIDVEAAF